MADVGNVETMLAGLSDADERRLFNAVFKYILKAGLRFGRATDGDAAENFGGGFFAATTPAIANEEFTVAHTFGRTPYLLIPVLPLDTVNAKIVRLHTSRAADSHRIYLKSPDTDAAVFFYLEG
jgi:hypothetical protein